MTCLLKQPTCILWDCSLGVYSIDHVSCTKLAGTWWKAWLWSWSWWFWWGPRELKSFSRVMFPVPKLHGFDSSIFKENPFHLLHMGVELQFLFLFIWCCIGNSYYLSFLVYELSFNTFPKHYPHSSVLCCFVILRKRFV
jgi:hypothetical protein